MTESICPECGRKPYSTHPLCVSCREPVKGQKRRTWGKVEWKLNREDPEVDVWQAWYGPNVFAFIEDLGGGKYQPFIIDKKTNVEPVAIPYSSLGDLKRQLETFKEM